ncbi:YesL family protein [Litchfieldia alkalitelluris]|uniref:YesL family protein n=1 Tax=Litchfieldia alkalitelluris TaxID=304268 RepID=UPI0009977AD5|nr:YesL family protein [Litchfieldia alkalitelluris]
MVETHGFLGAVNNVLEWISRLALLNLLWIFFSFLGLIVFGLFPATVAMFSVVRRWAMGEMEISITKVFWKSYKKEFAKSNLLGGIISSVGLVLVIDFLFLKQASPQIQHFLFVPFLIILILFICTLFYVFPMYVHYEMKLLDVLKNSFIVMIMRPLSTIMMFVCGVGLMILLSFAPPLLIICSGNVFALLMTKPAMNAFNHINRKYEKVKGLKEQNVAL